MATELSALGFTEVDEQRNGVFFSGDRMAGPRACLWSRLASRILLPLAEFRASDGDAVYRESLKVPWEDHISSLNTFAIHGIGTNQYLRHSGFLALKVKDALVDRIRRKVGRRPNVDKHKPQVRIVARLYDNRVTLSLDLSGVSLHKRGWRRGGGMAPLKESLAAAILHAARFDGEYGLIDPMCGSGTLLIEAAEMALGLASGRRLEFGFESWPAFPKPLKKEFERMRREALKADSISKEIGPLVGSDHDMDQVRLSEINIRQAGLESYIKVSCAPAVEAMIPTDGGLLVCNPPYGERLEQEDEELLELYSEIGAAWRDAGNGMMALFCAHPGFRKAFALKPKKFFEMFNGPIATRLYLYDVGGDWKSRS